MLPSLAYADREWFEAERQQIFRRSWLIVGRTEDIGAPGDFFTFDIAGESVLLVHGKDEAIRAFSPSCRHRGTLVATGKGNAKSFVCPYHHWSYGLDGRLIAAPEMRKCPGFDPRDHGLAPVPCTIWEGFIFVNLDPAAADLAAQLGELPGLMAPYRLADMRVARERRYTLNCNWKSYMDNSVEAYHVPSIHSASLDPVAPMGLWQQEIFSTFYLLWAEFAGTLGVLQGEEGFPPIEGFRHDRPERHSLAMMLPNTVVTASIDAMWYVTLWPVGPQKTIVVVRHAFPKDLRMRSDFATIAERYYRRFDLVNKEDNAIVELQHRGIVQPMRIPGPFAPQEALVHAFANYIVSAVTPGSCFEGEAAQCVSSAPRPLQHPA